MNEKICQNCGKQNPLDMNFCLDCGQPLATSASNLPGDSAPTVFAPAPQVKPNFQPTPSPNFAAAQPPKKKSRTGFWLAIVGGIGLIGVLIVVGIIGLVAANWDKIADEANNQNRAANLATPTPRRIANSNANSVNANPSETVAAKTPAADDDTTTAVPRVEHDKIWVDHDVKENGKMGMRVHAKFTTYNMKGVDSHLAVYFAYRNGEKLTTTNKSYASTDGQVAVFRPIKPEYDPAVYNDASVFIPYTELRLGKGKYDLKLTASIIYGKGGLIQHLEDYDFDYTF